MLVHSQTLIAARLLNFIHVEGLVCLLKLGIGNVDKVEVGCDKAI